MTEQTPAPAAAVSSRPPLPPTFLQSSQIPQLQYQGAEALVYKTHFPILPETTSGNEASLPTYAAALKHRPPKPYRHPLLDARLTRHRILAEARVLARLRRELGPGSVPGVYALDWEEGWMMCEWIHGETVKALLERELGPWVRRHEGLRLEGAELRKSTELWKLMGTIGRAVGRLHSTGVVHGDLTTSNLMLQPQVEGPKAQPNGESSHSADQRQESFSADGTLTIIDFGLANTSEQHEDRAVDLYVLERAFGSTHPRAEALFGELLRTYGESFKGGKAVLKKFEEVRLRGRKRSMVG